MEDPVLAYDHWGFLKELGLDYGWGPTAFIQSLLENVYIYTGLPWWASLVTTVLVIRIAMLKLYIDANDMATRNGTIKPLMKPLLEKLKEARNNKDPEAMMKVQNERRAINSSAGISMRKSLMPLIQIPLGFGTFRLLRGMGYLPVPGLEVGGALWFKDLTLADPYGILPIATGIFYFYSFKLQGDTGAATEMSPAVKTVFLYVIPFVTTFFSLFWPAGLQLTLCCTGLATVTQALAFQQPWLRNLLGMHPLPTPSQRKAQDGYNGTLNRLSDEATGAAVQKKTGIAGVIETFREAYADIVKKGEEFAGKNQSSIKNTQSSKVSNSRGATDNQAKLYEQKRQREIAQRRFEQAQAQASRKEDRRKLRQ